MFETVSVPLCKLHLGIMGQGDGNINVNTQFYMLKKPGLVAFPFCAAGIIFPEDRVGQASVLHTHCKSYTSQVFP